MKATGLLYSVWFGCSFFSLIIAKVSNSILFILGLCLMGRRECFPFLFLVLSTLILSLSLHAHTVRKTVDSFKGLVPMPFGQPLCFLQNPFLQSKSLGFLLWCLSGNALSSGVRDEHSLQAPRHCTASSLVGTPQWFTAPSFSYHDDTACLLSDPPG